MNKKKLKKLRKRCQLLELQLQELDLLQQIEELQKKSSAFGFYQQPKEKEG